MTLFVDTSVWSLTYRRDAPIQTPEVAVLIGAIRAGDSLAATGLVLQELLQGFHGPKARDLILDRFSAVPLIVPDRDDYISAADLGTHCRRRGRQVDTIDILFAQLCIRYDLTMLSADKVFAAIAPLVGLKVWAPSR